VWSVRSWRRLRCVGDIAPVASSHLRPTNHWSALVQQFVQVSALGQNSMAVSQSLSPILQFSAAPGPRSPNSSRSAELHSFWLLMSRVRFWALSALRPQLWFMRFIYGNIYSRRNWKFTLNIKFMACRHSRGPRQSFGRNLNLNLIFLQRSWHLIEDYLGKWSMSSLVRNAKDWEKYFNYPFNVPKNKV